jgi:phosphate transport system substrate-binding protein
MQSDFTGRKAEKMRSVSNRIRPPALAILLSLFLVPFHPSNVHSSDYLTASGCSVSNVGYLTQLAREYERRTGVKIFVRGGGSAVGINDLSTGKVDFAAACRAKDAKDPDDIVFVQVAWDALAFIVHKSNPVDTITLDEVRDIYAARIVDWKQLGGRPAPVKLFISRSKSGLSGVAASFRELVLNNGEPAPSPNTRFVASTGIVEQLVEETPEGFAVTGITSARKRNVKLLNVNGVAPTNKSIIRNQYPLKRPLYLLVPKKAKPEVKRFVEFTLSSEGQRFLQSLDVVSLLDVK